jgi:hypothetical protein
VSDLAAEIRALEAQIEALPPPPVSGGATLPTWWSVQDAMTISAATLVFGLVAFLVGAYVMRREQSSDALLRVLGTILIVFSTLFLLVAGYTDAQVAPAFGLLGTIAGYIFGKSASAPASNGGGAGTGPSSGGDNHL